MSLAKFRKVFKGHKKPSTPSPKVSPDNTDNKQQDDKQAPSRISSVVEQPPCKRQVLSSILRSGSSSSQHPLPVRVGTTKSCILLVDTYSPHDYYFTLKG